MRAFLAGGLLLATTPAAADELAETRVGALHDRVDPEVAMEAAHLFTGWRVDASLAKSLHAATASVGGEVALSHEDCDILVAGGALDVTTGDGAPVSAQQWASFCPLAGDVTWRLDHQLQWDVVPTLLARPRLRPEASRVESFSVTLGANQELTDADGTPRDDYMTFVETTMGVSIGWIAGDGEHADATVSAVSDFLGYHRDRVDDVPLDVDLISVEMIGTPPAQQPDGPPDGTDEMTMLARIDAVRWSGARWFGLRVGGALGFGLVDAGLAALPPHRDTLVIAVEPALTVERDLDDELTLGVAAESKHWPMYDGRAVIDDRATVSLTRRSGRLRLRAEGFAALSFLIAGDDRITRAATGGLTCVAETDLGSHAVMRVRSDVGRGFYAANATLDEPRLAGEVLATIDLHAGNR